jgi:pimeloyl-ACP methyl ester carboxylesterase
VNIVGDLMRRFILPLLTVLLTAAQSGMARSYKHSYALSVPVYVITDRGLQSSQAVPQLPSLNLSLHAGIVRVPLHLRTAQQLNLSLLESWGCTVQDRHSTETFSKQRIEMQLSKPSGFIINTTPELLHLNPELKEVITQLNDQIAKSPQPELLVFIHGCCESQQQALIKAAQLSVHCGSPVLLFDWASPSVEQAGIWSYMQSDRALELTELYFGKLMEYLSAKISHDRITLIAHSMGTKLVRGYLRQFPNCFVDQVHLVRPDISLPVFLMEQNTFSKQVGQMCIYISENDRSLQSSELLMSGQVERLGRQHDPSHWFGQPPDNAPANTIVVNTSKLRRSAYSTKPRLDMVKRISEDSTAIMGHGIPYEAIGFIHSLKTDAPISLFKIEKPYPMNPNFWNLRSNE